MGLAREAAFSSNRRLRSSGSPAAAYSSETGRCLFWSSAFQSWVASCRVVNGFGRKHTPCSRTCSRPSTPPVCPEVNRHVSPGLNVESRSASSRPLISGMTTSVTRAPCIPGKMDLKGLSHVPFLLLLAIDSAVQQRLKCLHAPRLVIRMSQLEKGTRGELFGRVSEHGLQGRVGEHQASVGRDQCHSQRQAGDQRGEGSLHRGGRGVVAARLSFRHVRWLEVRHVGPVLSLWSFGQSALMRVLWPPSLACVQYARLEWCPHALTGRQNILRSAPGRTSVVFAWKW
jgi:hypothetical protein